MSDSADLARVLLDVLRDRGQLASTRPATREHPGAAGRPEPDLDDIHGEED